MSKQNVYFIELTQGQQAIVDEDDFEYLNQFNWFAIWSKSSKRFYAQRHKGYDKAHKRIKVSMHRELLQIYSEVDVVHINGDSLDNRKVNLRICIHAENMQNTFVRKGESPYRGCFKTQEEAYEAVKQGHIEYYGVSYV